MNQPLEQLTAWRERNANLSLSDRSIKDGAAINSKIRDFFIQGNRRWFGGADLRKSHALLEGHVAVRTEELERVNRTLESFSYSVSHELRAPLRHIAGYTALVMQANAGKLDIASAGYLQRIALAAGRMTSIIDGLQQLSLTSRMQICETDFSLSELSATVIQGFAQEQPGREVRIAIAPDMRAKGDASLMRIVMENLLGNAWKFTARTRQARIEVGQYKRDGEQIYFVSDNGAGFDMNRSDKLFEAFHRMHTQNEFEGTGVGLSIVQRIVAKHGGRIWAEAEVGKGAVFHFTLGGRAQSPADKKV